MANERLWFQQAVEGLLVQSLGARLTPEHRAHLLGLGFDVKKLRPAYTDAEVRSALTYLAESLWPGRPVPEGLHELGGLAFTGFSSTFLGSAALAFMRLLGPERAFLRTAHAMRSATNAVEVLVATPSPGTWEFTLRLAEPALGPFVAGIICQMVRFRHQDDFETSFVSQPDGTTRVTARQLTAPR